MRRSLLRDVAERLKAIVDGKGLVARLSGDEFAAVVDGADAVARAKELSERISLAFAQTPFSVGSRELCVNVSIGVAVYSKRQQNRWELLVAADLALYQAKAAGRARYAFFEPQFRDDLDSRLLLEDELGLAVKDKQFEIFYQPQVNLADGRWWARRRLSVGATPAVGSSCRTISCRLRYVVGFRRYCALGHERCLHTGPPLAAAGT